MDSGMISAFNLKVKPIEYLCLVKLPVSFLYALR